MGPRPFPATAVTCKKQKGHDVRVDSSTAGPGRHHGRPGKWENRGLLGSSLDRVLDNDASLMLTTVWKRGKPAKMAVRAQENRACGAKKGALRAPPEALSDDHVGAPTPPWGSPRTPSCNTPSKHGAKYLQLGPYDASQNRDCFPFEFTKHC